MSRYCSTFTIRHGVTGFLVEPKNSEALSWNIEHLLHRKDVAVSMGKRARQEVEEKYNIELKIERILEVYASLLGEKH